MSHALVLVHFWPCWISRTRLSAELDFATWMLMCPFCL